MLQSHSDPQRQDSRPTTPEVPTRMLRASEGKRYGDKAASAILKRAVELQQQEGEGTASGMTRADLERIAAEVGIDARHLQAAVQELEAKGTLERGFSIWGGPTSVELERIVDGEVPKEQWDVLLQEIMSKLGMFAMPVMVGNTLTMQGGDGGMTQVTISSRGGKTRINLAANFAGWAGGLFGGIVGGCSVLYILPMGLPLLPIINIGLCAGVFATIFGSTRALFRAITRRRTQKMKDLLDRLADTVAELTQTA